MSRQHILLVSGLSVGLVLAVGFFLPTFMPTHYDSAARESALRSASSSYPTSTPPSADVRRVVEHVPLPSAVKAIYMTACVAGTPSFREEVVALVERTEVNALVIDIKDYSGTISFPPKNPLLMPAWEEAQCGTRDMEAFITTLHKKGIFVIGRITVFQDPLRTRLRPDLAVKKASDGSVWRDHKGLSFVDVSAKDHWEYILALAELNFDYIRFPSDGNMKDIAFTHTGAQTKPEALEHFFSYLHAELSKPERFASVRHEHTGRASFIPYLSADLFGMVTTNTDDLSIGQVLERALPYFDFVAPMVYPSHYPNGYMNLGNPNHHPYKVVHHAMSEAVRRATVGTTSVEGFLHERVGTSTPPRYTKPIHDAQKLRPWLQDFDYGGNYGPEEVQTQIQATYDAGLTSWMLWAPSNRYTEAALKQ
jgi:hypothetical protein